MPVAMSDSEIYTLDELIKRRASELRDLPSLGYPKEGLTDYEEHSASALDGYVDAAAHALQQRGLKPVVSTTSHSLTWVRVACSEARDISAPAANSVTPQQCSGVLTLFVSTFVN